MVKTSNECCESCAGAQKHTLEQTSLEFCALFILVSRFFTVHRRDDQRRVERFENWILPAGIDPDAAFATHSQQMANDGEFPTTFLIIAPSLPSSCRPPGSHEISQQRAREKIELSQGFFLRSR